MPDQENLLNLLFQYCFGRRHLNGQFINLFRPHHTLLSRHSLLTFAISVMLSFLEIKYQGKTESPFETHPKTMLVAVASVILYCFSYDADLRISTSTDQLCFVYFFGISMAFFGPLSLASLSSVLFPGRLSTSFLFSTSILFSLCEFPCSRLFRMLWNWVQRVMNLCPADADQRRRRAGRRRRRRRRVSTSVYPPRHSLSERANELRDQLENLPM